MIVLFYGCTIAITVVLSMFSRCTMLKLLAVILFIGWLVYANTTMPDIGFNVGLDATLLALLSLTYAELKGCKYAPAAHIVAMIFVAMLNMHGIHWLVDMDEYAYRLSYNLMFLSQCLVIIGFSVASILNYRKRDKANATEASKVWELKQRTASPELKLISNPSKRI